MAYPGPQRPETLHDLLDIHRIQLGEPPRAGHNHGGARSKLRCPNCDGGRQHERNFYVKIDDDMMGASWMCQRATCGFSGGDRVAFAPRVTPHKEAPRPYRKPTPEPNPQLPDPMVAYFAKSGISEATLQAFGIYRTVRKMPVMDPETGKQTGDEADRAVIAYPYYDRGELVNVKYKSLYRMADGTIKKRFKQEYNPRPTMYNIDAFVEMDTIAIIVEGEEDVLALHEVGFKQVTTLADGSPPKVSPDYDPETDDDKRYAALRDEPRIQNLEKIYLAGDEDEAGRRHHEEIARRVGKHRCWVVRWPEGCKDAKDTLVKGGADAILDAFEKARPYPLEGVEEIDDQTMLDLQSGKAARRIITGYHTIDQRIALSDAGQLIIVTGVPFHGKSAALNSLSVLYAERAETERLTDPSVKPFHTIVYSGETDNHRLTADLVAMRGHAPVFPHDIVPAVTPDDMVGIHLPWIRQHFSFLHWPDPATEPPIKWVMGRVRELVRRTSAKLVILDPWQEFDLEMPDNERNESRWIGKVLGRLRALAIELRVNIALVVHPSKRKRHEGKFPMPVGDDIADSRFFQTKASLGLTVHRPDMERDEMLLHVWKAKDARFGRYGDTKLRFDRVTMRVWPMPAEVDALATPPARERRDIYG